MTDGQSAYEACASVFGDAPGRLWADSVPPESFQRLKDCMVADGITPGKSVGGGLTAVTFDLEGSADSTTSKAVVRIDFHTPHQPPLLPIVAPIVWERNYAIDKRMPRHNLGDCRVSLVASLPDIPGHTPDMDDEKRSLLVMKAMGMLDTVSDMNPGQLAFARDPKDPSRLLSYPDDASLPAFFRGKPIAFFRDLNSAQVWGDGPSPLHRLQMLTEDQRPRANTRDVAFDNVIRAVLDAYSSLAEASQNGVPAGLRREGGTYCPSDEIPAVVDAILAFRAMDRQFHAATHKGIRR